MAVNGNGRKRKNVSLIVRDEVANTLISNPQATGRELKRVVEKSLKRKGFLFSFTARTYQNIKKEMGKPLADLDRRWSIGAYMPQGDIMPLLSLQRQLIKHDRYLTTRRARWCAILYPALSSLLEQVYPDDTAQNELRLMQIASFYCRKEQIAEVNGRVLDTSDLDNIFLIGQSVGFEDIVREWVNLFLPGVEKLDDLTLTPDADGNTELLLQFANTLIRSGVEQAIAFVKKHPEVQPLAEKWMVLSTRQDIINLKKDGEK